MLINTPADNYSTGKKKCKMFRGKLIAAVRMIQVSYFFPAASRPYSFCFWIEKVSRQRFK